MVTIPTVTINELTQVAAQIGHRLNKRHPKMSKYIQGSRNGVSLIDLKKTVEKLQEALVFVEELGKNGALLVLVGTKPSAKAIIKKYGEETNIPHVHERWLGGTMTNFSTISKLVDKLKRLSEARDKNEWQKYTKKERLNLERDLERLETMVGGLRGLTHLPEAIYIVDIVHEATALNEANKKKIPIVAITDTDANPEKVNYCIPANDDATRSIELITGLIVGAYQKGRASQQAAKTEKVEKKD